MKGIAATLAGVAVLAPAAYATGQALDPRVPALKRQVAALRADVKTQASDIADMQTYTRCLAVNQQGVAEYEATVAGTTFRYLDYVHGTDAPHGFVQYPPGKCPSP